MFKKILLTVGGLLIIVAALAFAYILMIGRLIAVSKSQVPPPTAVTTASATAEDWPRLLPSVGTVSAVQGVTVSAQLDGVVVGIDFQPGARVKAGDVLVRQDVSSEEAQLQAAQAAVQLAAINLRRTTELLRKNTIAQSQFDTDRAAYDEAIAQAENIRTTIAKKTIRAPFAGRLGVRQVDLGQMLKAGDPIVTLDSLQPVFVDFYVPQQELGELQAGLKVRAACDAYPGWESMGSLTTISPEVDQSTRNLHLQATLPNTEERLRPGMYVNMNVVLPGAEHVVAIPLTSVVFAPYGDTVFVVQPQRDAKTGVMEQVVEQRIVRLGTKRGDFVAVDFGLKPGEVVVTSGAFKLRSGMPVVANNALAPAAQLAPTPSDS